MKIGFIGLGVMGYPMAGHLARAGHEVAVFNRTADKAERWREEYGGEVARTPEAVAADAKMVFACVGKDDDVRAITTQPDGAFAALARDAVFVDHTTTSAQLARELAAEAAQRGFAYLDAPVSGGQVGAVNGTLTVMVGGDLKAFTRAEVVIRNYARTVKHLGPSGSGQLAKMVNQICIAGLVQSLAEAIHFGKAAGLDVKAVIEVISKGAAQSWQMENRHQAMIDGKFDFGFAVDWMRKDLAIVLDEARRNGAHLPIAALVDQFYAQVQSLGGGRWDTSSLIALLESR